MSKLTLNINAESMVNLTAKVDAHFKILFDYSIEEDYRISSIDDISHPYKKYRKLNKKEKSKLYRSLCLFIEEATAMTYTEVDEKYGRTRDQSDMVRDIMYPNEEFPMIHYKIANSGIGSVARLHGYLRNSVFVVRRMDWGHRFHNRKNKESIN